MILLLKNLLEMVASKDKNKIKRLNYKMYPIGWTRKKRVSIPIGLFLHL